MSTAPRVLVTGAAGFVGAAVARVAAARGLRVIAAAGPRSSLDRLTPLAGEVEIVRVDLTDAEALAQAVARARPDVAIHLAAAGAVVREPDLATLLAVNAVAPVHLARALGRAGAGRLVTVGSSSEYGTVDGPMHEALACAPDEPYGATKLAGGHLARVAAREAGIESAHLRPFSVYGPGEDPRRLVTSVVRALLAGRPVPLTAGEQGRDFVYVDDVADVCLAAALRPGIDGLTANVGSGVETTVRALCTTIADLTGGHALLRFGERPYSPTERFRWRADPRHAERTLGWRASTPLPEGLARTVDAERGAGGLRAAA